MDVTIFEKSWVTKSQTAMVATKKSVTVNTLLNVLLLNVQTDCEEME